MLGLMLKDLLNMRKYLKTMAGMLGLMLFMGIALGDASFMTGTGSMLAALVALVSFSYDESSHWDAYGATLPVTRSQYISAKYLLSLGMFVLSALVGMEMTALGQLATSGQLIWENILGVGVGALVAGVLMFSILCPCVCQFGVERSKVILMAALLLPSGLLMLWARRDGKLPPLSPVWKAVLPYLFGTALLLLLAGSYYLSRRIYEKKDF